MARVGNRYIFNHLSGLVSGLILASLYVCYIIFTGIVHPELLPKPKLKVSWTMRWKTLGEILLPSMLVLLVLGSIFLGVATPTEAAGVDKVK